jgi:hypothetical protein
MLGNGYTPDDRFLADKYLDVVISVLNVPDLCLNDLALVVMTVMNPAVGLCKTQQDLPGRILDKPELWKKLLEALSNPPANPCRS